MTISRPPERLPMLMKAKKDKIANSSILRFSFLFGDSDVVYRVQMRVTTTHRRRSRGGEAGAGLASRSASFYTSTQLITLLLIV